MNPDEKEILMIPVQAIRVANPRVRERRKFEQIVRSIAEQGHYPGAQHDHADVVEGVGHIDHHSQQNTGC